MSLSSVKLPSAKQMALLAVVLAGRASEANQHDYGEELTLEDDTADRQIADLKAKLDVEGHLISIPVVQFAEERGLPLAMGDMIKITAVYDNPAGKYLPDSAMGIMVGYFLPYSDGDYATPSGQKKRP